MRILTVNAGSSSLKLRLVGDEDQLIAALDLPPVDIAGDHPDVADAVRDLIAVRGEAEAVGHRIVHGGTEFRASVRIDASVEARLRALTDLAPLHQPRSLAAMDAVTRALPDAPAVACFDTAFHAGMPAEAFTYPVPAEWRERYGARRYGFHGLSHAYAARRAAALLNRSSEHLRVVTCHLGAGASLAAVDSGRSVDTTMGFTPLDGLVMATRCGSLDPGLVLWLQLHCQLTATELSDALEHRAGLSALAGTPDMRSVIARAHADDSTAKLALGVYIHRLRAGIAAMTAALGGLDTIVLTGGVCENAPTVRSLVTENLGFLGIQIDASRNETCEPDVDLSVPTAQTRTLLIAAREDLEIANEVRVALAHSPTAASPRP